MNVRRLRTTRALAILIVFAMIFTIIPQNAVMVFASENVQNYTNTPDNTVDDSDVPIVLSEITDERDENVKKFRMSNGTIQVAQYPVPVHYKNEEGKWVDYNNSLKEHTSNEGNKEYKNSSSDLDIRLSKNTNSNKLVKVKSDGYSISWNFEDIKKKKAEIIEISEDDDCTSLEKLYSEISYKDVYDNIDLQYIISSGFLKENIIINGSNVQNTFITNYSCPQMTAKQLDDKTIAVCSSTGEVVFVINTPYMQDANGNSSDGITLEIIKSSNGKFSVQMTLDDSWLCEQNRRYPITVDPIMTTSQKWNDSTTCHSAFVASGAPSASFGRGGTNYEGSLYAGYEAYGSRGIVRSYLKCSSLPQLSVCDKIVDARISLYMTASSTTNTVEVHKVKSDWNSSTITWNNQPSADHYITTDYKQMPYTTDDEWITWEITDLVRGWYSGDIPNYGIMLKLSSETSNDGRAWFFSTDYTTYTGVRPILVISYRNMSGYEDYYTYTSTEAGNSGIVSVNNYNGNLIYSQYLTEDCGGDNLPVNISLIYNSNKGGHGYTFIGRSVQTNFHIFISENYHLNDNSSDEEKKYKYFLNDADGTEHYFYFENLTDTTGKDEDGLGYTLSVNNAVSSTSLTETKYVITDKDSNTMSFNGYGKIISIKSPTNNAITIEYEMPSGLSEPRIKCIKDGSGRPYTFTYVNGNTISTITDPANRVITIGYSNDNLWSITYPDGKQVGFYNTNGYWTQINGINSTTLISYDLSQNKRVTTIESKCNGNTREKYSFVYKQNETFVTDLANRIYTYQFNDYAQTTGVVSNNYGQAQFFSYEKGNSNNANANKLTKKSKVRSSTVNYMANPSFSRDLPNTYISYSEAASGKYSITRDTTKGHFSNGSLRIHKDAGTAGRVYGIQEFQLPAGTYTFSAYVNTFGEALDDHASVSLEIWGTNGIESCIFVDIHETDDWERYSVIANVAAGKTVKAVVGLPDTSSGTVWFDDVQLESGSGETSYNLIENGGFKNGLSQWSASAYTHYASVLGATEIAGQTNACYSRNDSVFSESKSEQTINISGKKGDVFSLGAWAFAVSAPLHNNTKEGDTCYPEFNMQLEFYNSSGALIDEVKNDFNSDVYSWQYSSFMAIAPQDYSYIKFVVEYSHNVNNLFFTGAFCYKEEFGQTYSYDKDGNIVSSKDLAESQSAFAYYGNQMTKLLNPSGSRYMYTYDEQKKLTYALSSDGQEYSFTYDAHGNVTGSTVISRKAATEIEDGKVYYIINSYSGQALDAGGYYGALTTTFRYNPYSVCQRWKAVSAGEENAFYFESVGYDEVIGSTSTYYLDVWGASAEQGMNVSVYPENRTNAQIFKVVQQQENTFGIMTKCSNYEKCLDGQLQTGDEIILSQPVLQAFYYPNNMPEGMRWYFYEVESTDSTAGKQITSTATYSSDGNYLQSVTDSAGNTLTYEYYTQDGSSDTKNGQLKSVTDANHTVTTYTYEPNSNRLSSVSSGNVTNDYEYDSKNNLKKIVSSDELEYCFEYDDFGRTTAIKVGNGETYSTLMTTSYDYLGRPTVQTYGNGNYLTTTYDLLDRVTEIKYNNDYTKSITYAYNSNGDLSVVTDYFAGTKTTYTYDLSGRVVAMRTYNATWISDYINLKSSLKYTYQDKTNYLVGVSHYTAGLGTQDYTYRYGDISKGEMPDQLYSVSVNGEEKQSFTYDGLGRVTAENIHASQNVPLSNTYTYKDVQNSNRTTTLVSNFTNAYGSYSYHYDADGNITRIDFTRAGESEVTKTTSYGYDSHNQLLGTVGENAEMYEYTYDNAGNLLTTTHRTLSSTDIDTYTYGDTVWRDRLTAFNGEPITYDEIGNPLSYLGATLSWTNGRRLAGYTKGELNVSFAYDAGGQRISKTVNGVTTQYIYNQDILLGQVSGNNTLVWMYGADNSKIGFTYNGTGYYYICNLQGDVDAIADENGNIVVVYEYNEWGEVFSITGSLADTIGQINPIRYRGYYYDTETGFYYLQSRYYDPVVKRFINADSQLNQKDGVLGFNMFAYCHNNPVIYSDPTGHSITLTCIIIGAVIGAVAGGCSGAYVSKKKTGKVNGWAVAAGAVGGGVVGGLVGWGVGAAITAVGAAVTGSAATASAPVVQQVVEKASNALQTYYPPNDGFSGAVQKITLEAGTLIQHTGDLVGKYIAPAGTPTQMLSLPYDKIGQPTTILQVQQSVEVLAGRVATWFGQIGGGIQYKLGTPLDQLISEGIIEIFGG